MPVCFSLPMASEPIVNLSNDDIDIAFVIYGVRQSGAIEIECKALSDAEWYLV